MSNEELNHVGRTALNKQEVRNLLAPTLLGSILQECTLFCSFQIFTAIPRPL